MSTTIIAPPAALPVSLGLAKTVAKVEHNLEDDLITIYIGSATRLAEKWMRRPIITTTYEKVSDEFDEVEQLDHARAAVQWVKYIDPDGVQRALDPQDYDIDNASEVEGTYLAPAHGRDWPLTRVQMNAVRIRYTAGFGNSPAEVPTDITNFVLQHVKAMYESKDAGLELKGLKFLLADYVVYG